MTVYKEKHPRTGKLRYRVDIVWTHPDGSTERVRKTSPVASQRGADQYERDIRNALAAGTWGKRRKAAVTTFGDFRQRYFDDHVAKMKASSQSAQETIWRVSLLPTLTDVPLAKIDAEVINKLTRALRERELSPKSINNALSVLRSALVHAEECKLIAGVPRVRWLKVPQQKFDFFTFEESAALVAVASPMVIIALKTGMRIGELLALKWSDISIPRTRVLVERSVFWEKGKAHEGGTKTNKVRSIPLTSEAVLALQKLAPEPKDREGYVFTDELGEQLTRNECRWPLWRAEDAAKLRRTGWHVCRHTFASHLVMRGVSLPAVQQLMGHTTIAMTMKYAHLAPDHLRLAMDALEPTEPAQ